MLPRSRTSLFRNAARVLCRSRQFAGVCGAFALVLSHPTATEAALVMSVGVNGSPYCISDQNFPSCQGGTLLGDANFSPEIVRVQDGTILGGLQVVGLTGQSSFGPSESLTLSATTLTSAPGVTFPLNVFIVLGGVPYFGETSVAFEVSGTWSGAPSPSHVSFAAFNDPTAQLGGQNPGDTPGAQISGFSTPQSGNPSFSYNSGPIAFVDGDAYSMTLAMNLQLYPGTSLTNLTVRQTTVESTTPPVVTPEPASMLLLGTGLLGAGVRRWRQTRT
jgi:hypothetical protein